MHINYYFQSIFVVTYSFSVALMLTKMVKLSQRYQITYSYMIDLRKKLIYQGLYIPITPILFDEIER